MDENYFWLLSDQCEDLCRKYEREIILRCFTERNEAVLSKNSSARKNGVSIRFGSMMHVKYRQEKLVKLKLRVLDWA